VPLVDVHPKPKWSWHPGPSRSTASPSSAEWRTLVKAAQSTGVYIPRFFWHEPHAIPVGMFRCVLV